MDRTRRGSSWKKICDDQEPFQRELETQMGQKLRLKINDNRTSMLSVKWERDIMQVSLHRIFLNAPQDVVADLALYLRRKRRTLSPSLKAFIDESWQQLDYSHLLEQDKLATKGHVYDLKEIYDKINAAYFDNQVNLYITWYGIRDKKGRSQVTFGLYYDAMRLIKINLLLDSPLFPRYVVEYVVYHEMLHHVCPTTVDATGRRNVHSIEFKKQEKQFHAYKEATQWIEENYADLFTEME